MFASYKNMNLWIAFVASLFGAIIFLSNCSSDSNIKVSKPVAQIAAPKPSWIAQVDVTNANNFDLQKEPIYFSFYDLGISNSDPAVKFLNAFSEGVVQVTQIVDRNGDGTADGILFAADFKAAEKKHFVINSDSASAHSVSKNADQNILKLKQPLSAGSFGFWDGKRVEYPSQVSTQEAIVTNNGDLFSAFKINFQNWKINHQSVDVSAQVSMTAASRLINVKLTTPRDLSNIAISLAKHPHTKIIEGPQNITGGAWTYVASWGKQSVNSENDSLGVAIVFKREDRTQQTIDDKAYVSVMKPRAGELEYYFVSVLDQESNNIKTETEFKHYLDQQIQRLTKSPRINLETQLSAQMKAKGVTAETALAWSKGLADSELQRKTLNYHYQGWDEYRKRPPKFEYDVVGMQIGALQELNQLSPDPVYVDALKKVTGSYISDKGEVFGFEPDLFSVDLTKPGQMVILLEQLTHEKKYRTAADFLRDRLKKHPRTSEGAFWHRATYPEQLWMDGVYMAIPFLAQYAATYEKGEQQHHSFVEAVNEFEIARKHLRDEKTGLYYHAWDESKKAAWADKTTGHSAQFWSRGIGWYAMALVDVLDFIPPNEIELRERLIKIIRELAPTLINYEDAQTHAWWQITDRPNDVGNYRESTASAMFTYFLVKAVNHGYLSNDYRQAALDSYSGLIKEFARVQADGKISMTNQCLVAGLGFGRDGSYEYYMTESIVENDPKGNTPFILAGLEVAKLLNPRLVIH